MNIHAINPVAAVDAPPVRALLKLAIGSGDAECLRIRLADYIEGNSQLVAAHDGDQLVGILGFRTRESDVIVKHIATPAASRKCGVGRSLIEWLASRNPELSIVAETDNDSVGFYRRLGFSVTSLGEKYPGVERFSVRSGPDATSFTS